MRSVACARLWGRNTWYILDICRGNVTLAVPILYKSPGNIYVKTLIVTPKVEGGDKGTEVSLFSSSLPPTRMKP